MAVSMETFTLAAVAELSTVVAALRAAAGKRNTNTAVVVALHGDLGAGKTTFVQHVAKSYSVCEIVTSPTFVVMKQYELEDQAFDQLIHIDAYRLDSDVELSVLGFAELLATPRTLICVEWAEKVSNLLPADAIHLSFTASATTRVITLDYGQEK